MCVCVCVCVCVFKQSPNLSILGASSVGRVLKLVNCELYLQLHCKHIHHRSHSCAPPPPPHTHTHKHVIHRSAHVCCKRERVWDRGRVRTMCCRQPALKPLLASLYMIFHSIYMNCLLYPPSPSALKVCSNTCGMAKRKMIYYSMFCNSYVCMGR